jgi:hypothetical protein
VQFAFVKPDVHNAVCHEGSAGGTGLRTAPGKFEPVGWPQAPGEFVAVEGKQSFRDGLVAGANVLCPVGESELEFGDGGTGQVEGEGLAPRFAGEGEDDVESQGVFACAIRLDKEPLRQVLRGWAHGGGTDPGPATRESRGSSIETDVGGVSQPATEVNPFAGLLSTELELSGAGDEVALDLEGEGTLAGASGGSLEELAKSGEIIDHFLILLRGQEHLVGGEPQGIGKVLADGEDGVRRQGDRGRRRLRGLFVRGSRWGPLCEAKENHPGKQDQGSQAPAERTAAHSTDLPKGSDPRARLNYTTEEDRAGREKWAGPGDRAVCTIRL